MQKFSPEYGVHLFCINPILFISRTFFQLRPSACTCAARVCVRVDKSFQFLFHFSATSLCLTKYMALLIYQILSLQLALSLSLSLALSLSQTRTQARTHILFALSVSLSRFFVFVVNNNKASRPSLFMLYQFQRQQQQQPNPDFPLENITTLWKDYILQKMAVLLQ